ncbi:MAG TPA: hypothetical protein VF112_02265 [Candidatus Dormibacteraeota bacterium]
MNRFTRVPDRPVPELPAAVNALVPVADLFMLVMVSRPATGSLRRTWVTPATLYLSVAMLALGVVLGVRLLGGGVAARIGGAVLLLVAAGAGAVALVGLAQRRST